MSLLKLFRDITVEKPVVVVALEGWIDAGFAAEQAMSHIMKHTDPTVLGMFDANELIDFRSRRPTMIISDGVNKGINWPKIEILAAHDGFGNDLLLVVGVEPDLRWREFSREVVDLAFNLQAKFIVGFGAFPAPAPHTRPVRLAATSTDEELAKQVGFINGSIEVPAGIQAAIEEASLRKNIRTIGLWARVPHYVASMKFPGAAAALIDGLCQITGVSLDSSELFAQADITGEKVDQLISESDEHVNMVKLLESNIDISEGNALEVDEIPSGDEIADELEKFLRDQS